VWAFNQLKNKMKPSPHHHQGGRELGESVGI
jgi:hypothetical protein